MSAIAIGCGSCLELSELAGEVPTTCPVCATVLTGRAPRVVVWLRIPVTEPTSHAIDWLGDWSPNAQSAMIPLVA